MMNPNKWQRAELLVFTLITIVNILPFISTWFFPSLDGASHLSNSNIINQLVVHNNSLFHQFFKLNPEPVPNWTSHLLISLFTLIMPAFLAEKILILILLAGIPFAFRNLMQTIAPKNYLFSFLIFPFTHSMFFFFGFFNFCMAVLFFLVTLNYWLKNESQPWNAKKIILLALLVAVTYFSHIVIFGLLLLLIAIHIMTDTVMGLLCRKSDTRTILRNLLKRSIVITAAAIVPLILFAYFFYSRPGTREITRIAREELVKFLVTVRPLISFNPEIEGKHTTILFYLLLILAGIGLVAFAIRLILRFIVKYKADDQGDEGILPRINFWWLLVSGATLLALYFTLPDAYGTASYTNLRIGFIFFLVAILWISTFRIPWWIGLLAAITGLYVNTLLLRYYAPNIRDLGKLAVSCNKAADFIAPNSLVLPIYCMDNWFTGHFVDYVAVDKPIVMVYNYECQMGYFPVVWNEKDKPNYYLGDPADPSKYINMELTKGRPSLPLDYVFVVGQYDPDKDWFFTTLHKILSENFIRVYEADNCSLYQNKLAKPN
jgi:hypothetical protein